MTSKPQLSDPISLRLPADVLAALEAVAVAMERPRSWVIARALRRYLATEGAEVLEALAGRAQLAGGEAHDLDEVLARLDVEIGAGGGKAA